MSGNIPSIASNSTVVYAAIMREMAVAVVPAWQLFGKRWLGAPAGGAISPMFTAAPASQLFEQFFQQSQALISRR
jgi:hypothetical protein